MVYNRDSVLICFTFTDDASDTDGAAVCSYQSLSNYQPRFSQQYTQTETELACSTSNTSSASQPQQRDQIQGIQLEPTDSADRCQKVAPLLEFLLDELADPDAVEFICWSGRKWEFELLQPDILAQRWGERKNRANMNAYKFKNLLRYHVKKGSLANRKVKPDVYRFTKPPTVQKNSNRDDSSIPI